MDAALDAVFLRVETAFTTLVDSIAAYNPSLQAAGDLIAADDELARGMDQRKQRPQTPLHPADPSSCAAPREQRPHPRPARRKRGPRGAVQDVRGHPLEHATPAFRNTRHRIPP